MHDPIHHAQTQAVTALCFRGEEGVEDTLANRILHAEAGIDDF